MGLDSKQFLAKLQSELAAGEIEIAGFPDSCIKILKALKDDYVSTQVLERLVRQDPALSRRVLTIANSAAFQPLSGVVADVGGAIARIGLATLRTVVLGYAFVSLREQKVYKPVQARIGEVWGNSISLATYARACSLQLDGQRVDRDGLILGSMLSGVGKIYMLAEMAMHEEVLADFAAVEYLLETWHVKVAKKMLQRWEFSESVVRAATTYQEAGSRDLEDPVGDLIYLASLFVEAGDNIQAIESRLPLTRPAIRLGLTKVDPRSVLSLAESEAAAFGDALA